MNNTSDQTAERNSALSNVNCTGLDAIAAEITRLHARAEEFSHDAVVNMRAAVVAAHHCGQLLIRARETAGRGNFAWWLTENVPTISRVTAYKYLALASRVNHVTQLEGKTLRQSYLLLGIVPQNEKAEHDSQPKALELDDVLGWLGRSDRLLPADIFNWPDESKQKLKERLKPLHDIYEAL